MTEIFISYSRRNKTFAKRFLKALNANGYSSDDVWVDWEDIPASSKWENEIKKGIEATNSVIFLLSPEWAASKECLKELRFALEYNKRLFPVVCKKVNPSDVPAELASLNWIFFRQQDDFNKSLDTLLDALKTDLDYVAKHTELLRRANEWDKKGRDSGSLLRGGELQEAETFLKQGMDENKQPRPTSLQSEYVLASRQDDAKRQRRNLVWVSSALAISVVLAVMAVIAGLSALRESQRALASQLAAEAISLVDTQPDLSLLLSLEANHIGDQLNEEDVAWTGSLVTILNSSPRLGTFLHAHQYDVRALAFSSDGHWLATAGGVPNEKSGEVFLWDLRSAVPQSQRLETGQVDRFLAIDFSADGQTVVAAGDGKQLFVWKVEACCQPVHQWSVSDKVRALRIVSLDGRDYAAAGIGNQVTFWDLETGRQALERTLRLDSINDKVRVMSLALAPDGHTLAVGSEDGYLTVWDLQREEKLYQVCSYGVVTEQGKSDCDVSDIETKEIRGIGFNSDGTLLTTGSFDTFARLWDAQTGKLLAITPDKQEGGHLNAVTGVAFRPGSNRVATVSFDNNVRLWDVVNKDGQWSFLRVDTLAGHANSIWATAFSPDGATLASVSSDKAVILWKVDHISQIGTQLGMMEASTWALATAPSGQQVAAGDDSGNIRLWAFDGSTFKEAGQFKHPGGVLGLTYAHKHPWLASVGYDGVLRVWDLENNKELWSKKGHDDETWSVAFSPDDRYLSTASYDKTVKIWDTSAQTTLAILKHDDRVFALGYNQDGTQLLVAGYEARIYRWDVTNPASPEALPALEGHVYAVNSLAFNDKFPQLLASTSDDKTLRLWNLSKNEPTPPVLGLNETMEAVAFRPGGDWLASATDNSAVLLWQLDPELCNTNWDKNACQPGRIGDPLVGHTAPVQNMVFLSDDVLVSSDNAGQLIYWNLNKTDWYQKACEIVQRNFNPVERAQYIDGKVNDTLLGAVAWIKTNLLGAPAPAPAPACLE